MCLPVLAPLSHRTSKATSGCRSSCRHSCHCSNNRSRHSSSRHCSSSRCGSCRCSNSRGRCRHSSNKADHLANTEDARQHNMRGNTPTRHLNRFRPCMVFTHDSMHAPAPATPSTLLPFMRASSGCRMHASARQPRPYYHTTMSHARILPGKPLSAFQAPCMHHLHNKSSIDRAQHGNVTYASMDEGHNTASRTVHHYAATVDAAWP